MHWSLPPTANLHPDDLTQGKTVPTDLRPGWTAQDYERASEPGSVVRVAVTDGRHCPDGRTFVVAQGIGSWVEPFEMQRFTLIAQRLAARLVVVEVPGFGVAGSRLILQERLGLLAGDFRPLALRLAEAARAVLDGEPREPLSYLGYSMGASVVAAMAAAAACCGAPTDQLVLVEPVGLRRWRIPALLRAVAAEDRRTAAYVATNRAVPGAVAPWDQRPGVRPATNRRTDLLALGAGLRTGAQARDVAAAGARRMIIVRARDSRLSAAGCEEMVDVLRRAGVAVGELIVPGHHAFWHSLPAVDAMTQRLAGLMDTHVS